MPYMKLSPQHPSLLFITLIFVMPAGFFGCTEQEESAQYGWFDFAISDLDTARNDIDLSFLNEKVAGESGHVRVKDGHFVDGKGNKIRFFGTNLTFSSCFPDKNTAVKIAARLRKMGMNVVRFHHLDMRATPAGIWDSTMLQFDPDQVAKLDWLIYQLKQHGIYTNLNLHVSRTYPGEETDIRQFRFGKSLDHYYRPFIDLQKEFARDLLTHVNSHTGLAYTDDPAIAFVELNNENSLLSNWQHLPKLSGKLKRSLTKEWKSWLKSEKVKARKNDLMDIIEKYEEETTAEQKALLWRFLVEVEMAYAKEMTDYVKDELKIQSLLTGSQASYSGIAGIFREATYSDFIDMHAYWEHPRFPDQAWSRTNWLIRNSSMASDKNAGTLPRFGQHRVEGMPLTISEYDHPSPTFFCAEMYPMLNSVAAFQDWDGIYHFNFDGPWDQGKINGFFSSAGHPLKQIMMPVGALLFRTNAIQPANEVVQLYLPESSVNKELVDSGHRLRLHGSNMNNVWEKSGAPIALPLMHKYEVTLTGNEVKLSQRVDQPAGAWISDTKELTWQNRDSIQSYFTVNTLNAKVATGYIGGKKLQLGGVAIEVDSTEFQWASIAIASIDGKSISSSSKVLIVAAGRVENSNMGWNDERTTVGAEWGDSPSRAEGIPAKVRFQNMAPFKAFVLTPNGNRAMEVKTYKRGNMRSVVLGSQHQTLWYLLER